VGVELEEAERALNQAQHILAHPHSYQPEEWMLLATLVGEADLAIQQNPSADPQLKALLAHVVADLQEVTNNFTLPAFLSGSRAARRRNKDLFSGKG
jgi:uncharacterized membrane protein YozB (DUF420 family)